MMKAKPGISVLRLDAATNLCNEGRNSAERSCKAHTNGCKHQLRPVPEACALQTSLYTRSTINSKQSGLQGKQGGRDLGQL